VAPIVQRAGKRFARARAQLAPTLALRVIVFRLRDRASRLLVR
jgi:hypothetical protein